MFNPKQKRLLALDGGGILGVMSLCILKRMEDQLRPHSGLGEDFRLCHFFDYIAGKGRM
jgi:patatin-like phospholipase/acyl hydrolase